MSHSFRIQPHSAMVQPKRCSMVGASAKVHLLRCCSVVEQHQSIADKVTFLGRHQGSSAGQDAQVRVRKLSVTARLWAAAEGI